MLDSNTLISIQTLQQQWQRQKALLLFVKICTVLGGLFFIGKLLLGFTVISGIFLFLFAALLVFAFPRYWRISEKEVALFLNEQYAQLEESTELLLLPNDVANLLEQIQQRKVQTTLSELVIQPPFKQQWLKAIAWLMLVCISGFFLLPLLGSSFGKQLTSTDKKVSVKEKALPGIHAVQVIITPPAYTAQKSRQQHTYAITAEEGAYIEWILDTDSTATTPLMILNDSLRIPFQPTNAQKTKWRVKHRVAQNFLYQIQWNKQLSTYYQLEMIKDAVPVINIQQPKQYTVIDYGMPLKIPLEVTIKDDYGLISSKLVLTVASGGGEAVKFNEQEVVLSKPSITNQIAMAIKHTINLQQLKMQPGDELYFYVKAMDNHQQETRSDIQIVNIADTAALMELDISINSLSLKPEFFRSQRQIIIETEQLLRDKDKISAAQFKEKSNELGVDQKLLRLRYGKFLGEESESNIGDSRFEDDDHGHEQAQSVFGDAQSIIDGFSHKHDNAEDASFFDPKTKKELKAVLTEMWSSELKLRTFFPKEALPFEYKALRLLKELQQQSRAYVAKTNQKTTPLKFEKRLTGDLSKIVPPLLQQASNKEEHSTIVWRKSMGILAGIQGQNNLTIDELAVLKKLLYPLNQQAIAKPSTYLLPFEAMRRMIQALENGQATSSKDQQMVLEACEKFLTTPMALPFKQYLSKDAGLSDYYFHHLNKYKK